MNTAGKFLLVPFLCAFVACPAFMFLHELGHYVAGVCLGATSVKLHYAQVTGSMWSMSKEKFARQDALWASAGPLVQAALAVGGFLWLRRLRKHRREAAPTLGEWLATMLALNAGRWLRGFTGPPSHPQPKDEAQISQAIGLPAWCLPYLLGLLAVIAALAIVRLHPPGDRVLPFLSVGLGGVIGTLCWMRLMGPFLLP